MKFLLKLAGVVALELVREEVDKAFEVAKDVLTVADHALAELLMLLVQLEARR